MATSLLVEGIPETARTEEDLAKFFNGVFGKPVVKAASFVRDTSTLLPLLQDSPPRKLDEIHQKAMKNNEKQTEIILFSSFLFGKMSRFGQNAWK